MKNQTIHAELMLFLKLAHRLRRWSIITSTLVHGFTVLVSLLTGGGGGEEMRGGQSLWRERGAHHYTLGRIHFGYSVAHVFRRFLRQL